MIKNALNSLTKSVIKNCFRKSFITFENTEECDSDINSPEEAEEFELWNDLKSASDLDFTNFEEYVAIDDNECTEDTKDMTDIEIIQSVYANGIEYELEDISDNEMSP